MDKNNEQDVDLETIKKETYNPIFDDIEEILEKYFENIKNKVKKLSKKK